MLSDKLKSNLINITAFIISVVIAFCLLCYPSVVSKGITDGLFLCSGVVIPSLFPFMVLSSFLVKSGFCNKIGHFLEPLTKTLFKLPGCTAGVIFMSLIGGFPVGAKMTYEMFENKQITKFQAKRMMLFCINAGPAFVINAVGYAMFGSSKIGVIIFASLCISSILIGIVTAFTENNEECEIICSPTIKNDAKISRAITDSASDGAQAIFSVCVWVILFSCLGAIISLPPISESIATFIKCILEVTSGCKVASESVSIPTIAFVLGWSGLCVHCQIMRYLQGVEINLSKFFLSRLVCATVSSVICEQLLKIFPCEVQTFSSNALAFDVIFSVSGPAAAALLFMSAMLILDLDTKREMC